MAFLLQGLAFIILVLNAALASLKQRYCNFKTLEVGLEGKTDPISAIPHTFMCSR